MFIFSNIQQLLIQQIQLSYIHYRLKAHHRYKLCLSCLFLIWFTAISKLTIERCVQNNIYNPFNHAFKTLHHVHYNTIFLQLRLSFISYILPFFLIAGNILIWITNFLCQCQSLTLMISSQHSVLLLASQTGLQAILSFFIY